MQPRHHSGSAPANGRLGWSTARRHAGSCGVGRGFLWTFIRAVSPILIVSLATHSLTGFPRMNSPHSSYN